MDLLARFKDNAQFLKMEVVDQVRLINAAARMFDAWQTGALTLQKLQTGGKQHVVVQYQQQVNVRMGSGSGRSEDREAVPIVGVDCGDVIAQKNPVAFL